MNVKEISYKLWTTARTDFHKIWFRVVLLRCVQYSSKSEVKLPVVVLYVHICVHSHCVTRLPLQVTHQGTCNCPGAAIRNRISSRCHGHSLELLIDCYRVMNFQTDGRTHETNPSRVARCPCVSSLFNATVSTANVMYLHFAMYSVSMPFHRLDQQF
jgi:hypothetical protein